MSNSLVFKNHHLHHYFQKLIKLSFFKTHRFMFQTRGIRPCFIHFLHFQKTKDHHLKKKKNHHCQDFQKSCFHFKLGAFGSTSFK